MPFSFFRENHLPLCSGEIVKFGSFVAGLVEDLDPDVFSKDDLVATVTAFGGDNPTPGMIRFTTTGTLLLTATVAADTTVELLLLLL